MPADAQVAKLMNSAAKGTDLTDMAPEDFVAMLAANIPAMADEFDTVNVQVGRQAFHQFRNDLRRGITLRVLERAAAEGCDRDTVAAVLARDEHLLIKRITAYAALYSSVELALRKPAARLLASDLERGIAARGADDATLIATWQAEA